MGEDLEIVSASHEETFDWGKRLAGILTNGDVIALYGELGSGKTVFTQGVCTGLGVEDYVTSPSFTLVQEYRGRLSVAHFDFYRLESAEDIEGLDIDGYLMADGVCIIEWAERGELFLPQSRISVYIDRMIEGGVISINERKIRLTGPRIHEFAGVTA